MIILTNNKCWGRQNPTEFNFNPITGNTNPLSIDQIWQNRQTEDGVKAVENTPVNSVATPLKGGQDSSPETDRIIQKYTISSDRVTITISAEANQFVRLIQFNQNQANTVLATIPVVAGSKQKAESKKQNEDTYSITCPSSFPHKTGDDTTATDLTTHNPLTQITTKFSQKCTIQYTYFFPYNGISPNGIPQNFTTFQTQILDHAGNLSPRNQSLTIYRDTENPYTPNIQNISSKSYDPIKDYTGDQNNPLTRPITKDTSISTTFQGERLSDLTIQTNRTVNTKSTEQTTTQTIRTGSNSPDKTQQKTNRSYALSSNFGEGSMGESTPSANASTPQEGNSRDQQNPDCITTSNNPIANRKLGTCNDGLYSFNSIISTDTSGNNSQALNKSFERDTTNPITPNISTTVTGMRGNETPSLNISNAEGYSTAIITITGNGQNSTIQIQITSNGSLNTSNFFHPVCSYSGDQSFSVTVKLRDRVGNVGEPSSPSTFTIKQCAICGLSNGTFAKPIHNPNAYIGSKYGHKTPSYGGYHNGVDYNGVYQGEPIYASAPGKVIEAIYTYSNNGYRGNPEGGMLGNHVKIDHGNGLVSSYGHFLPENTPHVQVGQYVDTNTQLGRMGNSGSSTGTHFHFGITLNGVNQDPEDFLGTQTTNLTPEEFAILCPEEGSGGADLEGYPDISKDEAKDLIANYLKNNIGHYTTIENLNPTTQTREEIQIKDILTKYPNTPETEVFKQYLYLEQSCNIYHLNLQRTENRNNQEIAYDAVLVVNPYNKQIYMVKNGIFNKYTQSNKWCGVIGVPRTEEDKAGVQKNSTVVQNSAWWQSFERGVNKSNGIYFYRKHAYIDNSGFHGEENHAYFTVNSVATDYHKAGGTWSNYMFPKGDTYGENNQKYCRQYFEGQEEVVEKENQFREINSCAKQEEFEGTIFSQNYIVYGDKAVRKTSLNLYSDGGNSSNKNKYDGNSKVWIISHGMNNTYTDMNDLANAIKSAESEQKINPIIILVDWSGARDDVKSPTDTDGWIRPTAEVLGSKLKEWGIENASELNFAGHSMGTMMVTEIASQLSKNANGMYFLDPPHFLPGTDQFIVDGRRGASNAVYNSSNGYTNHYDRANISRAFSGIKKNGDENWCGNTRLNRTAKESISVYLADDEDLSAPPIGGCNIHGDTIKAFSRLITDQKLTFDGSQKLNLHAQGVSGYTDTVFYKDDTDFDASLYVITKNDIQTIMTNDNGDLKMTAKKGGALYANYDLYYDFNMQIAIPNLRNRRTINITNFGNDDVGNDDKKEHKDRISLSNKTLNSKGEGIIDVYRILTHNNKPTIYRKIQSVKKDLQGNPIYTDKLAEFAEMVVDGKKERVDQLTNNPSALDPSQSLIVYR